MARGRELHPGYQGRISCNLLANGEGAEANEGIPNPSCVGGAIEFGVDYTTVNKSQSTKVASGVSRDIYA